jgi:hypothetical protein
METENITKLKHMDAESISIPTTAPKIWSRPFISIGPILLCLVAAFWAIRVQEPQPVASENLLETDFSWAFANKHLRMITSEPHQVGSVFHEQVVAYLSAEIQKTGLTPEIQETSLVRRNPRGARVVSVRNVMARIPGSAGDRALLLAAHYDTVSVSPGAGDNGAAVAALLEVVRILRKGPQLLNDVIVLFTDAEEAELTGATAFLEQSPWWSKVGLVINFDARGGCGPLLMYEMYGNSERLIGGLKSAGVKPVASSLMGGVSSRLGYATDLRAFRKANVPALNFAFIDCAQAYHTGLDTAEGLDQRVLQEVGTTAARLAQKFGGEDLAAIQNDSSQITYFNPVGRYLVSYKKVYDQILLCLEGLSLLVIIAWGARKRIVSLRGVTFGMIGAVVVMAFAYGMSYLIQQIAAFRGAGRMNVMIYQYDGYILMAGLSVIFSASVIWGIVRRWAQPQSLLLGAAIIHLGVGCVLINFLSAGTYFVIWPLLLTLLASVVLMIYAVRGGLKIRHWSVVGILLGVPFVILAAPIARQVMLGGGPGFIGMVIIFVIAISTALYIPIETAFQWRKWAIPAGSAALLLAAIVYIEVTAGPTENQPARNSLFFAQDDSGRKAIWASAERNPDGWTRNYLSGRPTKGLITEYLPGDKATYAWKDSPMIPLQPPTLTVLSDTPQEGNRVLRCRLHSNRDAFRVGLSGPPGVRVSEIWINGKLLNGFALNPPADQNWVLEHVGPSSITLEISLVVSPGSATQMRVYDESLGLPAVGGKPAPSRSRTYVPAARSHSDSTIVSSEVTL